jgi:hypothetical protein
VTAAAGKLLNCDFERKMNLAIDGCQVLPINIYGVRQIFRQNLRANLKCNSLHIDESRVRLTSGRENVKAKAIE